MRAVLGTLIVIGSILGGYLPHGNLGVLIQPLEILIIVGASLGAYVIATPGNLIKEGILNAIGLLKTQHLTQEHYVQISQYLYRMFSNGRRNGMMNIEAMIEKGVDNPMLSDLYKLQKNEKYVQFINDYLRLIVAGVSEPHVLSEIMESEIRMRLKHAIEPAKSIAQVAQSLPAFGIVAAVLGIIVTMAHISDGPVEIARHMSIALVGTFLGIFVAYGFVAPIANAMEHNAKSQFEAYSMIKSVMVANLEGHAPAIAIEFGRRMIPDALRPSMEEFDQLMKA